MIRFLFAADPTRDLVSQPFFRVKLQVSVLGVRAHRAFFWGAPLAFERTCPFKAIPLCDGVAICNGKTALVYKSQSQIQTLRTLHFPKPSKKRFVLMKLSKSSNVIHISRCGKVAGRFKGFRPPLTPSLHLLIKFVRDLHSKISRAPH